MFDCRDSNITFCKETLSSFLWLLICQVRLPTGVNCSFKRHSWHMNNFYGVHWSVSLLILPDLTADEQDTPPVACQTKWTCWGCTPLPSWWPSGGAAAVLSLGFILVCLCYSWPVRVSQAVRKRVCAALAGTHLVSVEDGGLTAPSAPATATKPACPLWTAATTMRQPAQVSLNYKQ